MSISPIFTRCDQTVRARPWLWLLLIYTAMLILHGFSESDIPDFLRITPDVTKISEPVNRQFLYSSPLNYIIGHWLNLPTVLGFYLIHAGEIILMLGLIILGVQKKCPAKDERIRFLSFLSLTPLWLVTLKWIGKPDPLLIGMMVLCWAYPGRWRWLAVFIMVAAHREMGSFMCLFLFLCEEKKDYSLILPIAAGIGFHDIYENQILDHRPFSRVADITIDIGRHPKEFLRSPTLYLFGSLTWYWLVAIWQKPPARLCLALAAAFGVAVVSEDFTRDFVLMALAPILFHVEQVVKTPASAALMRFVPLGFLQIQIASMGIVFKTNNVLVDWINGRLGDQLLK